MKIQNITYNNFLEIVKGKINQNMIKPNVKRSGGDSNIIQEKSLLNQDQIFEKIKKFLKKIMHNNFTVHVIYHKETKTYVIKVIDNETHQVVREAPLEKILDMISYMEQMIKERHKRR